MYNITYKLKDKDGFEICNNAMFINRMVDDLKSIGATNIIITKI